MPRGSWYTQGVTMAECLHCYRATVYNNRLNSFTCVVCERRLSADVARVGKGLDGTSRKQTTNREDFLQEAIDEANNFFQEGQGISNSDLMDLAIWFKEWAQRAKAHKHRIDKIINSNHWSEEDEELDTE